MTWKDQAVKHAEECLPQESCGLLAIIKGEKTYWPCKNIAETGFEYFVIDPDDWAECEDTGKLSVLFIHTHLNQQYHLTMTRQVVNILDYLGLFTVH